MALWISLLRVSTQTEAALTDAQALSRARLLWGNGGFVSRESGSYSVGCMVQSSGSIQAGEVRMVVASSTVSWLDAFRKVDLRTNGKRVITATARTADPAGRTYQSPPVTVYACNKTKVGIQQ